MSEVPKAFTRREVGKLLTWERKRLINILEFVVNSGLCVQRGVPDEWTIEHYEIDFDRIATDLKKLGYCNLAYNGQIDSYNAPVRCAEILKDIKERYEKEKQEEMMREDN